MRGLRLFVALIPPLFLMAAGSEAETFLKRVEPDSTTGTSKAVAVENLLLVHTTQILPFDDHGKIVTGGTANKTERVLAVLRGVLSNARRDFDGLVKLNDYISTSNDMPVVRQILARQFSGPNKPALMFLVTSQPDHLGSDCNGRCRRATLSI